MKVKEATRDGYYKIFIIIVIYGRDHLKQSSSNHTE